jgi:glycosyltransferase involved in cell wall biosynthesis
MTEALPVAGSATTGADADTRPRITSATAIDRSGRAARSLRVTIVAANTFEFDSRFLRTATTLAEDGHQVTVLAFAGRGLPTEEVPAPGVRVVRLEIDRRIITALRPLPAPMRRAIARLLGLGPDREVLPPDRPRGVDRLRHPLRRFLEILANIRRTGPWADAVVKAASGTDVYHCQALIVLPVVRSAAQRVGARFVYDVADYHSESERVARLPWVIRELVRRRESRWIRDASGFLAVSDPVADLVAQRWRIARPALLLNCPPAWRPDDPSPGSDRVRTAAGIAPERPVVLFQGGFDILRGLEELVETSGDPRLHERDVAVVFMGFGRLQEYLERAATEHPDRVHVLPAVPVDELLEWIAGADVSFVGQPPWTLNHRMNLPNKLFESIMAGVPVIVSEGNEQCRLVTAERVGRCAVIEPASIASAIAELLDGPAAERRQMRAHCRKVALTRYTWDENAGGLVDLYRRLASEGRTTA